MIRAAFLGVVAGLAGLATACADERVTACPIELLAAQIVDVHGGGSSPVIIDRQGKHLLASKLTCVQYGDRVMVGPGFHVTIDTPAGLVAVGGETREWDAPPLRSQTSGGLSTVLKRVVGLVLSPVAMTSVGALGRGGLDCAKERPQSQSRLQPPSALRSPDQTIGSDLTELAVAWKPLRWPGDVHVRLKRADGTTVVEGHSCAAAHLTLPLAPGMVVAGTSLVVDVSDGPESSFGYTITVVTPGNLIPSPPAEVKEDWVIGALRLIEAPAATHLDAVSRLETASGSLAARRLLEAVWQDTRL